MKRILVLLFASVLVLASCGDDEKDREKDKQETKVNEDKPQFTNDTLVIDDAVLKIKDTFIVKDKDSGKKSITFKYEVKNKSGSDDVAPNTVFIAGFSVYQDTANSLARLETGITPTTGRFEDWAQHSNDIIKKGKTAKGILAYELENDNNVTLKATKGVGGKELGKKEINLSKLKTIDYSLTEDIVNEFNNSDNQNTTPTSNNTTNIETESEENVSEQNNTPMNDEQKSTKQDSEELPQSGIGGHPSLYDSNVAPPTSENLKVDENGDEYYDATNE